MPRAISNRRRGRPTATMFWFPASQANTLHEVWMNHIQGGSGVQVTKSSPTATTTAAAEASRAGRGRVPRREIFLLRQAGLEISRTTQPFRSGKWCGAIGSQATKT